MFSFARGQPQKSKTKIPKRQYLNLKETVRHHRRNFRARSQHVGFTNIQIIQAISREKTAEPRKQRTMPSPPAF